MSAQGVGAEERSGGDFELVAVEDEPNRHGPLGDSEPPTDFVRAGTVPEPRARRARRSKGRRRHERKTKALARDGRSRA
jgi:hypothetical protein